MQKARIKQPCKGLLSEIAEAITGLEIPIDGSWRAVVGGAFVAPVSAIKAALITAGRKETAAMPMPEFFRFPAGTYEII